MTDDQPDLSEWYSIQSFNAGARNVHMRLPRIFSKAGSRFLSLPFDVLRQIEGDYRPRL
jgi:hypothetical protein